MHILFITGQWSAWSAWSACSASCGEGEQTSRRRCQGNYCQGPATLSKKCKVAVGCFNYYDYTSFDDQDWNVLESNGYVDPNQPSQYGDYEYEQLNNRDLEILGSRGLIDNPNGGGFDSGNTGWEYKDNGGMNQYRSNGWEYNDYNDFQSIDDQDLELLKSRGLL